MESLLVVLACFLIVMLELMLVFAILAPDAVVRALRRLDPRPGSSRRRRADVTPRARA
jgi:hypothetical protein